MSKKSKKTPTRVRARGSSPYAGASRAENTKHAYTNDFVAFSAWCEPQGLAAMPALPGSVALYLTALAVAEKKVATIERALVAICQAHKLHGFPSPGRRPRSRRSFGASAAPLGVAPTQNDPVLG